VSSSVRTCVITGYGINADEELATAFRLVGAEVVRVHVGDLLRRPDELEGFHILAFPGGFSFGDHLGSGKVLAGMVRRHLRPQLARFIESGGLLIGICNGFQVLIKMGILPDLSGGWRPEASLIHNDSGKFEDRWVHLRFDPDSPCVWTRGIDTMELPVRHGEGKLVLASAEVRRGVQSRRLDPVHYTPRHGSPRDGSPRRDVPQDDSPRVPYPDNPNGSAADIAGLCDPTGRVFGLMPHPEAFLCPENHPRWPRERIDVLGLEILRRGVSYAESG